MQKNGAGTRVITYKEEVPIIGRWWDMISSRRTAEKKSNENER